MSGCILRELPVSLLKRLLLCFVLFLAYSCWKQQEFIIDFSEQSPVSAER